VGDCGHGFPGRINIVMSLSTSPTRHYTSYGTITPTTRRPPSLRRTPQDDAFGETRSFPSDDSPGTLHRGLSSRQVQMIAIAGTIGTGLFLGTGRSLAQGGPASMLICYSVVGFIVYVTLLLLGEMATQYPVAGECLSVALATLRRGAVL
jgi:AAT family amino acid transporter